MQKMQNSDWCLSQNFVSDVNMFTELVSGAKNKESHIWNIFQVSGKPFT